MGCDIHSLAQVYNDTTGEWDNAGDVFPADDFDREYHGKEFASYPFPYRNYGLFGFLADVRNYARCTPLAEPRGLPEGFEHGYESDGDFYCDNHSASWFLLSELLAFDYDQTFENRRCTKQLAENIWTGAGVAEVGEGYQQTYRELVGKAFFESLDVMKTLGDPTKVRVVFWFDN